MNEHQRSLAQHAADAAPVLEAQILSTRGKLTMKAHTKQFSTAVVLCAALLLTLSAVADPPKDTLVVEALTSAGGTGPVQSGNNNWFYGTEEERVCVPSGGSFHDTLHLQVKVTNTASSSGPYAITLSSFNGDSELADNASYDPASIGPLADDGNFVSLDVVIADTGVLADGDYNLNFSISGPSGQLAGSPANVHLKITVSSECGGEPEYICFFTSSEFGFLQDCSGNLVTDNDGGTFVIVPTGNGGVSTNPGQIYYHFLWENHTGSPQYVNVSLTASGNLKSVGNGSMHVGVLSADDTDLSDPLSLTFDQFQSVIGQGTDPVGVNCFAAANSSSANCGPVYVLDGMTLWITWHMDYNGGLASSAICSEATGAEITVDGNIVATVGDWGGVSCGASAHGYNKE
jgi:hypothetical protein